MSESAAVVWGERPGSLNTELVEAGFSGHELMDVVEVVGLREGMVDCWVPIEFIDHMEVAVEEENVTSIATNMRYKAAGSDRTGQDIPIHVGLIEGEDTFKIIDGFHREAALRRNGAVRIYATVSLTTWERLYDERIFNARNHPYVRFSRVVQWIREAWALTDLGREGKLSVEQAMLLKTMETSGKRLGLNDEEVQEAIAWVERKEEAWALDAMTMRGHLKIAEDVSPNLVHATREKSRSDVLEAPTQAILLVFSKVIPKKFRLQEELMQVAIERNMQGPEVRALCNRVADCEDLESVRAIVAEIDWDSFRPEYGDTTARRQRRAMDTRHKGAAVLDAADLTIQSVINRAKLSLERAEELTPDMAANVQAAIDRCDQLALGLGEATILLARMLRELPSTTLAGRGVEVESEPEPEPDQSARPLLVAVPDLPTEEPVEPQAARPAGPPVRVRRADKIAHPRATASQRPAAQPSTPRSVEPAPAKKGQPRLSGELLSPGQRAIREQRERDRAERILPKVGESGAAAESDGDPFMAAVQKYVDGISDDPPAIETAAHRLALRDFLKRNQYAGDLNRIEDMRERLQTARSTSTAAES